MPEGDTIHRVAFRLATALEGREIELADAPDPRSPVHSRASELAGRTLERVEARGKHLLASFSGGIALHSHLGMNGSWRISADGRLPRRRAWLLLASERRVAAQFGGKILRIVSESRLRGDPGLLQLGPDLLAEGFDLDAATARLQAMGAGREIGEAVMDQSVIAGIGNAIRTEAFFRARISPWRKVEELSFAEAARVLHESERVMRAALASGRRPRSIYNTA